MPTINFTDKRGIPASHHHSAPYVWYVIFVLTAVNTLNYVDRMALSVLAPSIKVELQLSDSRLALLIGFAFLVFYAACAIPISRWADRGIRRNIIALAVVIWSVMTALSGAAQNFWHLLLARIGVSAGEAGSYAPGASILCDYVPLTRRSGVLAIHVSGNSAGTLLGMALAGWLVETIGWRWTFVALGLPGLALALTVRLTLREPVRGSFDAAKHDKADPPLGRTIGLLWRCRTYRLLVLYWTAAGFFSYGLIQWWPSFYARVFLLDSSFIGLYLGIAVGVGGAIGAVIGGFVANKLMLRDARLPLRIGAAAIALTTMIQLGVLFVPSVFLSIVLVFLAVVMWGASSGPVLAAQYSVVPPHTRATAGSILIFCTSVLGGLGTLCVGVLSDFLTPSLGVESLRYALLAPVCVIPVMAGALVAAAKSLPDDLQAAGAQSENGTPGATAVKMAAAKS